MNNHNILSHKTLLDFSETEREKKLEHLAECSHCAQFYLALSQTVPDDYVDPEFQATAELCYALNQPAAAIVGGPIFTEEIYECDCGNIHIFPFNNKLAIKVNLQNTANIPEGTIIQLKNANGTILLQKKFSTTIAEVSGFYQGTLMDISSPLSIQFGDKKPSNIAFNRMAAEAPHIFSHFVPIQNIPKFLALFTNRNDNTGEAKVLDVNIAKAVGNVGKALIPCLDSLNADANFRHAIESAIFNIQDYLALTSSYVVALDFSNSINIQFSDKSVGLPVALATYATILYRVKNVSVNELPSFAATGVLENVLEKNQITRVENINNKLLAGIKAVGQLGQQGIIFYPSQNYNEIWERTRESASDNNITLIPVTQLDEAVTKIQEYIPVTQLKEAVTKIQEYILPATTVAAGNKKNRRKFMKSIIITAAMLLIVICMPFIIKKITRPPSTTLELTLEENYGNGVNYANGGNFHGSKKEYYKREHYKGRLVPKYCLHEVPVERMELKKGDKIEILLNGEVNYGDVARNFQAYGQEISGLGKRGVWLLLTNKNLDDIDPEQAKPYSKNQKHNIFHVEGNSGERLVLFTFDNKNYEDNTGAFDVTMIVTRYVPPIIAIAIPDDGSENGTKDCDDIIFNLNGSENSTEDCENLKGSKKVYAYLFIPPKRLNKSEHVSIEINWGDSQSPELIFRDKITNENYYCHEYKDIGTKIVTIVLSIGSEKIKKIKKIELEK